jgi:hypothetical protein
MWANLTSLVQQLLQETVMELEDTLSASLAMAGTLADTAGPLLQGYSTAGSTSSSRVSIPDGSSTGNGKNEVSQLGGSASSNSSSVKDGGKAATAVMLLECSVHLLDHAKRQAAALAQPLDQEQQQEEGPAAGSRLCWQVADIQQQVRQVVLLQKWAPAAHPA